MADESTSPPTLDTSSTSTSDPSSSSSSTAATPIGALNGWARLQRAVGKNLPGDLAAASSLAAAAMRELGSSG